MDLAKAEISGTLKFSLVTKDKRGAALAIAAIPVFSSASLNPSLEASTLTETIQSADYDISIKPAQVSVCSDPSTNNWLTSRVIVGEGTRGGVLVDRFKVTVSFVVTKQRGAGLKLNIVPVAIGPQVSSDYANTQSLSLVFDFKKPANTPTATPPTTPAPPPVAR